MSDKGEQILWETCEVHWEKTQGNPLTAGLGKLLFVNPGRFVAIAIGTEKTYRVGASDTYRNLFNRSAFSKHVLDELALDLAKQGWERLDEVGDQWFSLRFRRRLANESANSESAFRDL